MKKDIIVLYKSKYGSTKRYAYEISEKLSCKCLNISDLKNIDLENYDTVVYGGGLYASGIYGVKKLKKYSLNKVLVFTVGLSNPEITDYTEIIDTNKKYINSKNIKFFHLRGSMDYSKLNFVDRKLMALVKRFRLKKKVDKELTNEDKEMLNTYGKKVNFINLDAVKPILIYVENLEISELK